MSNYDEVKTLIERISGQASIITVLRIYVDICGDLETAAVLSQCVFWSDKGSLEEGWFYKSREDWRREIGIKRSALDSAIEKLRSLGIVETKIRPAKHNSPTLFYRVDMGNLTQIIVSYLQTRFAEINKSNARSVEINKSDLLKSASPSVEINNSSYSSLQQLISSEALQYGISHPDFDAACSILEASDPLGFLSASPVLMEVDEHPNRMRVKLSSVPSGFMDSFKTALEQVTRRRYSISFETPGTGRAVEPEIDADPPSEAADMPSLFGGPISAADLELWQSILGELRIDIQPATYLAYIAPAHPISVNGDWTIAVPSVTWWRMHMPSALRRIYKGLTGHDTTFVFQEDK